MALNDKTRKHNDMDFQKDLSEILTNAKIGLWAIEMDEGKEPRMYFDDVAREITNAGTSESWILPLIPCRQVSRR